MGNRSSQCGPNSAPNGQPNSFLEYRLTNSKINQTGRLSKNQPCSNPYCNSCTSVKNYDSFTPVQGSQFVNNYDKRTRMCFPMNRNRKDFDCDRIKSRRTPMDRRSSLQQRKELSKAAIVKEHHP